MKQQMNRWIAVGTLGVMSVTGMGMVSGTAQAKKSTLYKYGAVAGAGLAGYGLLKGNGRAATVGAVAAAGSYYGYKHNKKKEDKQKQEWYRNRYGKNWRRHYNGSKSHKNSSKSRNKSHKKESAQERREDWYRKQYGKDWKRHYNPGH